MKVRYFPIFIILIARIISAEPAPDRFDPYLGTQWYGIYMQDKKIGYASISLEKQGEHRWSLCTDLQISLLMQEMETVIISFDERFYEGDSAYLVSNKMINRSALGDITVTGNLSGRDYEITLEITGNRQIQRLAHPLETLDEQLAIITRAADRDMKIGENFTQEIFVFEPAMLGKIKHVVTLIARQNQHFSGILTEVYSFRDSIPSMRIAGTGYFDMNGNMLLQEFPSMGMIMKMEPEELAKNVSAGWDIILDNIIEIEGGPIDSRSVCRARYLLSGFDADYLPSNPWTTVTGRANGRAEITIDRVIRDKYSLELPVIDPGLIEFIKSEPLIQSDNEEIRGLALEIIGDETNAFDAAVLINDWVFKNIEKRFSPVISNALQTLALRQGDCGEHAALTVALMRAAGIPARTAAGVGFVPSLSGFGFHAWVEVYVGEWIQMDPTWGETFADATHIMLARGDLKSQVAAVAGAMNSLGIEILEYK